MNQLALIHYVFEVGTDGGSLAPTDIVAPVIDGVLLCEITPDRFCGVALDLIAQPARHWLGDPTYEEDGRAVLLDGGCGIAECCGLLARIEIGQHVVRWNDFFARGRPEIPAGLHFEFRRDDYEDTIAGASNLPVTSWRT